jgi:hypothetical protein
MAFENKMVLRIFVANEKEEDNMWRYAMKNVVNYAENPTS